MGCRSRHGLTRCGRLCHGGEGFCSPPPLFWGVAPRPALAFAALPARLPYPRGVGLAIDAFEPSATGLSIQPPSPVLLGYRPNQRVVLPSKLSFLFFALILCSLSIFALIVWFCIFLFICIIRNCVFFSCFCVCSYHTYMVPGIYFFTICCPLFFFSIFASCFCHFSWVGCGICFVTLFSVFFLSIVFVVFLSFSFGYFCFLFIRL